MVASLEPTAYKRLLERSAVGDAQVVAKQPEQHTKEEQPEQRTMEEHSDHRMKDEQPEQHAKEEHLGQRAVNEQPEQRAEEEQPEKRAEKENTELRTENEQPLNASLVAAGHEQPKQPETDVEAQPEHGTGAQYKQLLRYMPSRGFSDTDDGADALVGAAALKRFISDKGAIQSQWFVIDEPTQVMQAFISDWMERELSYRGCLVLDENWIDYLAMD
jgi:hypothetical protein